MGVTWLCCGSCDRPEKRKKKGGPLGWSSMNNEKEP